MGNTDAVRDERAGLAEALAGPLILASASPRRQDMMREAGLAFIVRVSDAEAQSRGANCSCGKTDTAADVSAALEAARVKALDVARHHPGRLVVGADTVVAVGETMLGKPHDPADAARMLRLLSGKRHRVTTALAIAHGDGERAVVLLEDHETSQVVFKSLTDARITEYVATGEPLDKAGAYAVQGLGGELVEEVEGSFLNVVGLPIGRLRSMLEKLGWRQAQLTED